MLLALDLYFYSPEVATINNLGIRPEIFYANIGVNLYMLLHIQMDPCTYTDLHLALLA